MIEPRKAYKLTEIISFAYDFENISLLEDFFENYDLYIADDNNLPSTNSIVYLDEPKFIDEDEDVDDIRSLFSDFVKNNKLWICFYGEQFVSVVSNYKRHNSILNHELVVKALNYYSEHDTFLDY